MTLKQTKHNTVIRNVIDKKGIKSKKIYVIKIKKCRFSETSDLEFQ